MECFEDKILTCIVRELTREGAPFDMLFVKREGLVGDLMVRGPLRHSNHEIMKFSVFGEVRRAVIRTAALDFWRTIFGLVRNFVESPWGVSAKRQKIPGRLDMQEWNLEGTGTVCRKMNKQHDQPD